MSKSMKEICKEVNDKLIGPHDFVPTIGGRGQHHPHGLVGNVWRIKDPKSVGVGDCFLDGRLKKGDLFICTGHSGDCFQDYMYIEEYANCLIGKPEWNFGSYGIGDAEKVNITTEEFGILKNGGRVERSNQ